MHAESSWPTWVTRALKPAARHGDHQPRRTDPDSAGARRVLQAALEIELSITASRRNVAAGLLTVIGMAAMAAWRGSEATQSWAWLLLALLGQVPAFGLLTTWNPHRSTRWSTQAIARLLVLLGAYCSIAWGAVAWMLLPGQDSLGFIVLVTASAAIFVGGAAGMAYRPIVLALACPGPVVFALGLLYRPGQEYDLLAGGFILIGIATVLMSTSHMDTIRLAMHLGTENERLLTESRTQQRVAEEARAEAEAARGRAELADRGKTTFLAAAGHDLRQPLHALVQYHAHLVRENHDPALQDTVARIGKSLDAMRDLLDAMLEVSKLLTGTIRPEIRPIRLEMVLDRLDAQLRPVAEAKGLQFSLEVRPCIVATDDVLLERILRNLVLNAIRYTPAGRIGLRASRHAGRCRILIWDTGIGIPRAERSRIFDEFYQIGNEARDVRKGLGLGLAIVRQLGQLLDHPIRLRSRPGQGSVFAVELPLGPEAGLPADQGAGAATPDYAHGAIAILIDDNPDSLAATAGSLRAFGMHVISAASSLEAIDLLQRQEFAPQLIVSDYRLEGETGLDAIGVLRENQQALFGDDFQIAALLITGDTAPDELRRAQAAGIPMLHKPLAVDRLYDAVNGELSRLAQAG